MMVRFEREMRKRGLDALEWGEAVRQGERSSCDGERGTEMWRMRQYDRVCRADVGNADERDKLMLMRNNMRRGRLAGCS